MRSFRPGATNLTISPEYISDQDQSRRKESLNEAAEASVNYYVSNQNMISYMVVSKST